jgi:hypothetical protein
MSAVPPNEHMEQIFDKIEEEVRIIEGNARLMDNLNQKIQERISEVWAE